MLYNICSWWFFLSQSNQWTKYSVYPKIRSPKSFLLMFVSSVALDGFYLLLPTRLTANLTPGWRCGSMFHPLSHIYTKTPLCCVETLANNTLNCWCVVFDWLWANAAPTLNTTFSLTNVHAKWWIHLLLISSTLQTKWVSGGFWCFPGQLRNLGNLSVPHYLCLYDRI